MPPVHQPPHEQRLDELPIQTDPVAELRAEVEQLRGRLRRLETPDVGAYEVNQWISHFTQAGNWRDGAPDWAASEIAVDRVGPHRDRHFALHTPTVVFAEAVSEYEAVARVLAVLRDDASPWRRDRYTFRWERVDG